MKLSNYQFLETPIGTLRLVSDGKALTRIEFPRQHRISENEREASDAALSSCAGQLIEYFAGARTHFTVPLNAGGTDFQRAVWAALVNIPFGELRSYADIAVSIGRPKAVRAVGAANGRNPLPIVVPCHRVIGANGKLVGYGGGLWRKQWLLEHEMKHK